MNYLKFGTGNKTLVMLPGLSVKSVLLMGDAVKNAFRAYDKDFTIYLIDRREDVPPVYTVADMARDTAEKMKELGLDVPQVTELAWELQKAGFDISTEIIDEDECVARLAELLGE